jgi:ArsR family transcriptional regulator
MIDMLKAIAEENRFQIIKLLSEKSLCVCEIEEELQIHQNLVSHHLSVLKRAGLIKGARCGKNNYYTLNRRSFNKLNKELIKIGEPNENISSRVGMCDLPKTVRNS